MRWITVASLSFVVCFGFTTSASAKPKKKARAAAFSAKISQSLGDLRWGMSKKQLEDMLVKQAKDKFAQEMEKARGALEKDEVRQDMQRAAQQIKESYVEFSGDGKGWDASFLRHEYAHNNGEAMYVAKDSNSQNFYFLYNGKLWKWYKAFNSEVFPEKDFDKFAKAIEGRFGKGSKRSQDLPHGDTLRWIEWQDKKTVLRAIDQTQFYGFYCLVFEDKDVKKKLAPLHDERAQQKEKSNSLVDSVTGPDRNQGRGANVVDQITGKRRSK